MEKKWSILESASQKVISGPAFHSIFDKITGETYTWGENYGDDSQWCPIGPLIADIELSTICHGTNAGPCKFCYKSNNLQGKNMSFETYKQVFSKLPKSVQQIAFGIGSIDSHPQLFDILQYTRDNGVIPNLTINGYRMTAKLYERLVKVCGAVAVSRYNKEVCYNAVDALNVWKNKIKSLEGEKAVTLQQVNIHQVVSVETLDSCWELFEDMRTDSRLTYLNAAVFLLLKPKGKRNNLTPLKDLSKYKELVNYALDSKLSIGFDSCSAGSVIKSIKDRPDYQKIEECIEKCESTAFSIYIDVDGKVFPCSFTPNTSGWENGINILDINDFRKEIWEHPKVISFRSNLSNTVRCEKNCVSCPIYSLDMK
jgi:radical SAM protein with 4Fe4S-binding SPASM domain